MIVVVELKQHDEYRPGLAPFTREWTARANRQHDGVRLLMGYRITVEIGEDSGVGVLFTDGRIQGVGGSPLGLPPSPPSMPGA